MEERTIFVQHDIGIVRKQDAEETITVALKGLSEVRLSPLGVINSVKAEGVPSFAKLERLVSEHAEGAGHLTKYRPEPFEVVMVSEAAEHPIIGFQLINHLGKFLRKPANRAPIACPSKHFRMHIGGKLMPQSREAGHDEVPGHNEKVGVERLSEGEGLLDKYPSCRGTKVQIRKMSNPVALERLGETRHFETHPSEFKPSAKGGVYDCRNARHGLPDNQVHQTLRDDNFSTESFSFEVLSYLGIGLGQSE